MIIKIVAVLILVYLILLFVGYFQNARTRQEYLTGVFTVVISLIILIVIK